MAKLSLSFKGRPIAVHHLGEGDGEVVTIGRNADCTLVIDSLAIAPLHARISSSPDGSQITAMADGMPTRVNGRPVTRCRLSHGDIIQIGKHTLTFAEDDQILAPLATATGRRLFTPPAMPDVPAQERNRPTPGGISDEDRAAVAEQSRLSTCLQVVNGNLFGKVIPVERGLTRLGFSGLASAVIARRREGYFLSHLEGDQPPSVNGHSIKEHSRQLFDGDIVQIGNVRMIFHHQRATLSSRVAADG